MAKVQPTDFHEGAPLLMSASHAEIPKVKTQRHRLLCCMDTSDDQDAEMFDREKWAEVMNVCEGSDLSTMQGEWFMGRRGRGRSFTISVSDQSPAQLLVKYSNTSGTLNFVDGYWQGIVYDVHGAPANVIQVRQGKDVLLFLECPLGVKGTPQWDRAKVAHKDERQASAIHTLRFKIDAWDKLPMLKLPRWMYSTLGVSVSLDDVIGPCIPPVRLVVGSRLVVLLSVTWLSYCFSDPRKGYPLWLWSALVPVSILNFVVEMFTLRLLVVPYAIKCSNSNIKPFRVFGRPVSERLWLSYVLAISMSLSVDIISDSLFIGSTLISLAQSNDLEQRWDDLWHISELMMKLRDILILSLCSLSIQFLWPMISTLRKNELTCHGDPINVSDTDGDGVTVFGDNIKNGSVALLLSEPAGLASTSSVNVTLFKCRIGTHFSNSHRLHDCIEYAVQLGNTMLGRVVLILILENGLQMIIQHGMFIIRRAVEHGHNDGNHVASWKMLFSVATSMFCSAIKFEEVIAYKNAISGVMKHCAEHWDDLNEENKKAFYKARRYYVIVMTASMSMVLLLICVTVNMMSALLCPNVHWSFSHVLDSNHGCLP